VTRKPYVFRFRSDEHWIEVFRRFYGPVHKAFETLDTDGQRALGAALVELLARFNRSGDDSLVVPGDYLEVVIRRGSIRPV